jgi:hypothetical protein
VTSTPPVPEDIRVDQLAPLVRASLSSAQRYALNVDGDLPSQILLALDLVLKSSGKKSDCYLVRAARNLLSNTIRDSKRLKRSAVDTVSLDDPDAPLVVAQIADTETGSPLEWAIARESVDARVEGVVTPSALPLAKASARLRRLARKKVDAVSAASTP